MVVDIIYVCMNILGGELTDCPLVSKAGIEEVTDVNAAAACAVDRVDEAELEPEVDDDVEADEEGKRLLWNTFDITDNILEAVAGGSGIVDC